MKLRINRSRATRVRVNRVRIRRSWSAAIVACFGMFFVSAGIGLTATAANAASDKVIVCHATNSDTNPYNAKPVSASSTDFEGHLAHRNSPVQTWKKGTWFQDQWHPAGSAKPDLIDGLDGNITDAVCDGAGSNDLRTATASINVIEEPSCDNDGVGRWSATAAGATVNPESGTGGSGDSISATATAQAGYQFAGGSTTKALEGTFATYDAEACGGDGDPEPQVAAVPVPNVTQPTCANSGSWAWSFSGENVSFSPASSGSGTYAQRAGANTMVTMTADDGFEFAGGTTQKTVGVIFDFNYAAAGQTINAAGGCDAVLPPGEETPDEETPVVKPPVVLAPAPAPVKAAQNKSQGPAKSNATVIPTLVKAGLPGTPAGTASPTSPLGTALAGIGLMLLVMAGGIAITGRRHEGI